MSNQNSGKWVTLCLLGLAFLAAGVAWWNNWEKGHGALQYWGSDAAYRIRLAPEVMLFVLRDDRSENQSNDLITGDGRMLHFERVLEISQVKGLVHARQALIQDVSYQWPATNMEAPDWQYALRFSEGGHTTTVFLDLEQGLVGGDHRREVLRSTLGTGFRVLLADQGIGVAAPSARR